MVAYSILEDAVRLLESPLPTQAITTLWLGATGRRCDLEHLGIDGRDWLRQIADICLDRIRQDDPSYAATAPEPVSEALTGAVLDELRVAGAALTAATMNRDSREVSGVVPALEMAVTQVDPDLGFRLFLRAMKEYWVPIDDAQYARYVALGERFGYGEFLVDDVYFLTKLDAD